MTRQLLSTILFASCLVVALPASGSHSNNQNNQNKRNNAQQSSAPSSRMQQRRLERAYETRLRAIAEDRVEHRIYEDDPQERRKEVERTYAALKKEFEYVRRYGERVSLDAVSQAPTPAATDAVQRRQEERQQERVLQEEARRRVEERWARMGEKVDEIDLLKNDQTTQERLRDVNRREEFYKQFRREFLGLLKARIDSETR